jgi:hypothetical protein
MGSEKSKLFNDIQEKKIPHTSFNIQGNESYCLYKYCQICGIERFTDDEVKELSSRKLTLTTYATKYSNREPFYSTICNSKSCLETINNLIGHYPTSLGISSFLIFHCTPDEFHRVFVATQTATV